MAQLLRDEVAIGAVRNDGRHVIVLAVVVNGNAQDELAEFLKSLFGRDKRRRPNKAIPQVYFGNQKAKVLGDSLTVAVE